LKSLLNFERPIETGEPAPKAGATAAEQLTAALRAVMTDARAEAVAQPFRLGGKKWVSFLGWC
jgi:hypothetical protein